MFYLELLNYFNYSGYLLKRESKGMWNDWSKKYFVLTKDALRYYKTKEQKDLKPVGAIRLMVSSLSHIEILLIIFLTANMNLLVVHLMS